MKKFILFPLFIFLLSTSTSFAVTSYTWNGNISTDWATPKNWNPNGVPTTGDTVTIGSTTRQPKLDASRSIAVLTFSTDTLDLNGKTLTVTGTATFNSGFVNNGNLTISSTAVTTFAGTTFGAAVSATSGKITLYHSTFNSTLIVIKVNSTLTGNDLGKGNCTFNDAVTLIDSSGNSLTLSDSLPDTFNSTLTVKVRSSGSVYIAHRGTGNTFSGDVTTYSSSTGIVYFCYYGTAAFNGNLVVNSTSSGGCYFGMSSGSCTLASGKRLSIGITDGLTNGNLYLRNFTQSGSGDTTNLTATSSGIVKFETGSVWNAPVIVSAPQLYLDGSRFNSSTKLARTSSTGETSVGGNYFGGVASITNNASGGSAAYNLASTTVDTFATAATIQNSAGTVAVNNAVFTSTANLTNIQTTSSIDRILIGQSGTVHFKGQLNLTDTIGGIILGNSSGSVVLDTGSAMHQNSTYTGNLTLNHFTQYGPDSTVSINLTKSTASKLTMESSTINAPFSFKGSHVTLKNSTFNNAADIKRALSNATDTSYGGNVFNSTTSIIDTSTSSHHFILAYTSADTYNGDVTFNQAGAAYLEPAYNANSTFTKDLYFDGVAAINFSTNGGKVIFSGGNYQIIYKGVNYNPTFKKIQVNKSGGYLQLGFPLTLGDTMMLTKGKVLTDTTNLLIVPDNLTVTGGADSAYIHGTIKKIGNDAFTFPLGDTTLHSGAYHPLAITAPDSVQNAFTACYKASGSGVYDNVDTLDISNCEYWTLKHDVATSQVDVSLGWNNNSCEVSDTTHMVVVGHDVSGWTNYGKKYITNYAPPTGLVTTRNHIVIAANAVNKLTIAVLSQINTVLIFPDSSSLDTNGIAHVHKWEKYEIAFQLPSEYTTAVNRFFNHYYNYDSLGNPVDTATDLNPYAGDSLTVQVDLYSPTGRHLTKWAFFMREGTWVDNSNTSLSSYNDSLQILGADTLSPTRDYNWHFRFAPDEESGSNGLWTFSITISAPHSNQISFPVYTVSGMQFYCDPPLPDNHGYLKVNTANNRYLKFDDDTTFFGIGENMAGPRHGFYSHDVAPAWLDFFKMDYTNYLINFTEMKQSGGNFMRMWMYLYSFKPEAENLGVYDDYPSSPCCCNDGTPAVAGRKGNRQWGLWSLDKVMDAARANDVYVQLSMEQDLPTAGNQTASWGGNCYVSKYVYPTGTDSSGIYNGPYLHPEYYFISSPANPDSVGGALYYWKRRYKYMEARLGYSVNIAAWEAFNEVDQTLLYHGGNDLTNASLGSICANNRKDYSLLATSGKIDSVQQTVADWHSAIGSYLKDTLLDHHLFGTSVTEYATYKYFGNLGNPAELNFHRLFNVPQVDFADIHDYSYSRDMFGGRRYDSPSTIGRYWMGNEFARCDTCPGGYLGLGINKPFHLGECSTFGDHSVPVPDPVNPSSPDSVAISTLFDNYDVSFHNELWATAMMGYFTTGATWQWEVVHWWPGGTPKPKPEPPFNSNSTNQLGGFNIIKPVGSGITGDTIVNKKIYHNYQKLSDFFAESGIDLNDSLTPKYVYDALENTEVYYLVSSDRKAAYGWVHNINKYWANAYYYLQSDEKYYNCRDSASLPVNYFQLFGLDSTAYHYYDVTFYPTRYGQPLPDDSTGIRYIHWLDINFNSVTLGCDSLTSDFAFKVVQEGSGHRMSPAHVKDESPPPSIPNFRIYPNPTEGHFAVIMPLQNSSDIYDLFVYDLTVQIVIEQKSVKGNIFNLDLSSYPKGVYFIKTIYNGQVMFNKIIVQ